jgi:hypothetical protein
MAVVGCIMLTFSVGAVLCRYVFLFSLLRKGGWKEVLSKVDSDNRHRQESLLIYESPSC